MTPSSQTLGCARPSHSSGRRREKDTHRRGAGHTVAENGMAGDELGLEAGGEDERDGCETMGRSHGGQVGGSYKSEVKRWSRMRTMSRPSPGRESAGYSAFRSVPEFGPVLYKRLCLRQRCAEPSLDHLSHRASCYGFSYRYLVYASSTSTTFSGILFHLLVLSFPVWNRSRSA